MSGLAASLLRLLPAGLSPPMHREGMKLGFRMADIWWPADAAEAIAKGLVQQHEDGKLAVSAEDGAGRIVLHQLWRRIAVCYPLLIRDAAQEGAWEYIWQTQVFSLLACPLRWGPAVELLLQVAQHLEPREGATPIQARVSSCPSVPLVLRSAKPHRVAIALWRARILYRGPMRRA